MQSGILIFLKSCGRAKHGVNCVWNEPRRALSAPLLGSEAAAPKGSPELRLERGEKKERTINIIVGDGLCAVPQILRFDKNRRARLNQSVIAPKGTRRQINESWYAAVARPVTDVTGRGNPFLLETAVCFTYSVRGCGLPRRFAPRNDNLFILGSVFFTLLVSLLWRPLRHFVPLSRCGSVTARL